MAAPASITLTPIVRGDTWNGMPSLLYEVNGSAPTYPLAAVKMQFRKTASDAAQDTLTHTEGITINNAALWSVTIPPRLLELGAGDWLWDIQTTDSQGTIKTWLCGTLEILNDISR